MKKADELLLREKVDMKQREVSVYGVLKQNIRSVEKVDEVLLRENK